MSHHDPSNTFDFSVLRALRKREGLTIGDVSTQSGVSPAVISKLERNQSQAELQTLFRLARVFSMNATDLLALAECRTAHKTRAVTYSSGAFRFQKIAYGNVESFHGFAEAGGTVSRPEIHHDDYEVCWVLNGALNVVLPDEQHLLTVGEAIQFDAILEHSYEAVEDCEVLILHMAKDKRF